MQQIFVSLIVPAIVTAIVAATSFGIWVANRKRLAAETVGRAEEQALRIAKDAERDAESRKKEALLEAKERAHELLMDAERQARQERQQAASLEQTLNKRDAAITERQASIERLERELNARDRALSEREKTAATAAAKYEQLVAQQKHELERVAGLTADEAKDILIKQIEGEARHDSANLLKRLDAEAREVAVDRAKQYITEAIQRCGAEHAIETTVSVVDLPSDDLKGRIIGREGRNIRALEQATGVDLIVDDTPGAIILSGFDPYRREIAKKSIERLIADGRIHPARIEEIVQKVKDETDEEVRKEGAAVAFDLGLHDLHPEILRLMGRLKFRTSYGQNVLAHSVECAHLAALMASELGASTKTARRAALLHDIGKAVSHEIEGPHALVGGDIARKHGESEAVAHAMEAHHNEVEPQTVEAVIVQAADALSGARPGARGESLEQYVKRLRDLEKLATRHDGVDKVYAMQAGREIRVIVEPGVVSDDAAVALSHKIAREIEQELEYPGQIKVTVIRESRAVEYAR